MSLPAPRDTSRSIADLLAALPGRLPGDPVRFRQLLDGLGDRSMASALLLLAIPQVLPIPLLLSNLLALPIVVIAGQMALGWRRPWLPAWMLERPIRKERLVEACARVVPVLRRIERLIRPRLPTFWSAGNNRLVGLACLAIALVSLTPLPLTGWAPGWALLLVAIGLLQHDGLVVLAGLVVGALAIALFAAVLVGLAGVGEQVAEAQAMLPALAITLQTGWPPRRKGAAG